jgi:hypothetical protein
MAAMPAPAAADRAVFTEQILERRPQIRRQRVYRELQIFRDAFSRQRSVRSGRGHYS